MVLDQFWLSAKFCSAFTVKGNTIVSNYQLENDRLSFDFYSIGANPISSTGDGTEESPQIDTCQKAVLLRTK